MSQQAATAAKQPLDEVMLAMDVVDTLRHRSKLVEEELGSSDRDQRLMDRLRKIYSSQGIEVSDQVLQEGVAALKEDRFVYKPPPSSLSVRLAQAYVNRGSWGKWVGGVLLALCVAWGAWHFAIVAPRERLPGELTAMRDEVVEVAKVDKVDRTAGQLYAQGQIALRNGDQDGARSALQSLRDLRDTLEASYTIQVVDRPGQLSGVWRYPEVNTSARNFYIVVEAIGANGGTMTVPILNEESGETERVNKWALRVDEAVFKQVGRDKRDDGIIQNKRFGVKRKGYVEPDYQIPTTGAAITAWEEDLK